MFVRSAHNYDTNAASVGLVCDEPSQVQQHFKDQCDINRIVRQYGVTGEVPQTTRLPLPEDFVGITDYHTAMNAVRRGEEAFAGLSPHVRERFKNDPALFVDFCLDPANNDEAVALGLASKREISLTPSPTPQGGAEGAAQ